MLAGHLAAGESRQESRSSHARPRIPLWLLILCASTFLTGAPAAEFNHILRPDGKGSYSDYWGQTPIQEITNAFNLLGATVGLSQGGSNLKLAFVVALISPDTNGSPYDCEGGFTVEVRSSTNVTSPDNIIGSVTWNANGNHTDSVVGSAQTTITRRATERISVSQWLSIKEIVFDVPLRAKLNEMPEYISIFGGMCNKLWFWRMGRVWDPNVEPPKDRKASVASSSSPEPGRRPTKAGSLTSAEPEGQQASWPAPPPRITLSITKEKGYLLITCSPAVTNASLEQAEMNRPPFRWYPVTTGTGSGVTGWYVPPDDGARAFRVRVSSDPR